jgi:hypothetical protein
MKPTFFHISLVLMMVFPSQPGFPEELTPSKFEDPQVVSWAAHLECARKRYPDELFSKSAQALVDFSNMELANIESRAQELLKTKARFRKLKNKIEEQCPEARSKKKVLAKSHEVFSKVQCMAQSGLSNRSWQSRVQKLYTRYKISVTDYVATQEELMKDPLYQLFFSLHQKETCPSKSAQKKLILERAAPLKDGSYTGVVKGLDAHEIQIEINVKDRAIVSAFAVGFDQRWTLRPRTHGSKVSLSGKRGSGTLFFRGRMRSGAFSGRFQGLQNGREHTGKWTASRKP